jgi:hypothetical protein
MKKLTLHLAKKWTILTACLGMLFFASPALTLAASATEIDIGVNETLKKIQKRSAGRH